MAITLLRHAPVPKEYRGRYIGWSDIPIYTKSVNTEAVNMIKNQTFEQVFSSDLSRCTDTLKMLGFKDFITDKRLREVKFRNWAECRSFEEISRREDFSQSYLKSMESWHRYIADETPEEFRTRIESFLSELDANSNILICTHAGVMREILSILGYSDEHIDISYLSSIKIKRL